MRGCRVPSRAGSKEAPTDTSTSLFIPRHDSQVSTSTRECFRFAVESDWPVLKIEKTGFSYQLLSIVQTSVLCRFVIHLPLSTHRLFCKYKCIKVFFFFSPFGSFFSPLHPPDFLDRYPNHCAPCVLLGYKLTFLSLGSLSLALISIKISSLT